MNFSDTIDDILLFPIWPIKLTENSKSNAIRLIGITWSALWLAPLFSLCLVASAVLVIPAFIQDAMSD